MARPSVTNINQDDRLLFSLTRFAARPRTTLFPYTTLFRSGPRRPRGEGVGHGLGRVPRTLGPLPHLVEVVVRVAGPEDRKSTRLNSSHVRISYAVFCLKKKSGDFPVRHPGEPSRAGLKSPS